MRVAQAVGWHEVKADRSLLPVDASDDRRQQICGGIVALCDRLGIRTLAEGIETEEQAELCRAIGFDHAQGYYFARPMPAGEIQDIDIR
jgi:EAL domain-containing protein (putative c-di-GMP-specific phosphodiesterase class I)